jgi:hypothetical protein
MSAQCTNPVILERATQSLIDWLDERASDACLYGNSHELMAGFTIQYPIRLDNVRRSIERALRTVLQEFTCFVVHQAHHQRTRAKLDSDDAYVLLHEATAPTREPATPSAPSDHWRQGELQALRDEIEQMRLAMTQVATTMTQVASQGTGQAGAGNAGASQPGTGVPTVNVTTNTTTNNTLVIINDFGKENLNYMQSPENLLPLRRNGVFKAINQIHFDDEHMENQNVRLKSLKKSMVEVVEGGRWTPRCMTAVTEQMIQKAFKVIAHKYVTDEEYRTQVDVANGDGLIEWITKMWSMGHDKQTVMVPIKKDVQALLVSKRSSALCKPQKAIA